MSRAIPVIDELMVTLGTAMTETHVDHLLHLGVPPPAVDMCGTAKITPDGQHYVPDDAGLEALVVPVFDTGIITDLVAFDLASPARWWLRLGVAAYLGGDALIDAVMDEPVKMFRSPLAWLKAGAPPDGLVVLDDKIARRELADHLVAAEDLAHGLELRRRLSVPARHPRILIPRAA